MRPSGGRALPISPSTSAAGRDAYTLLGSTLSVSRISSDTGPTKVFTPNSLRLKLAVASAPQISLRVKGRGAHLKAVTVSLSGLLTPSSVRLPSTASSVSSLPLDDPSF